MQIKKRELIHFFLENDLSVSFEVKCHFIFSIFLVESN
jgi:hypothetical protein